MKTDKASIYLKKLSSDDGREIYELLQTMPRDENGLQNKANGMSYQEFKNWLLAKEKEANQKEIIDGWKVPSTTYWLYVGDVPVGFGNLRHFLTEALSKAGGNIGYGIAAQYRGKGYGKELLRLLLIEAGKIGLEKVLVTVHLDNIVSQKVALSNGGVISEKTDQRFLIWIDTKKIRIKMNKDIIIKEKKTFGRGIDGFSSADRFWPAISKGALLRKNPKTRRVRALVVLL